MKINCYYKIIFLLLMSFIIGSCSNDDNITWQELGKSFTPDEGEKGDTIALSASNYHSNRLNVTVTFDSKEAKVARVKKDSIMVIVPRNIGNNSTIKVQLKDGESYTYPDSFHYHKSWGLYTVTGNGKDDFKSGNLDNAQIKARYISVDSDNNIFATHRDQGQSNSVVARINEEEDTVEVVLDSNNGDYSPKSFPNASTIGNDDIVYVPDDALDAHFYWVLDPADNWYPERRKIDYVTGDKPDDGSYLYKLSFNSYNGKLYGITGGGNYIEIDPNTNKGKVIFKGNGVFAYGQGINSFDNMLYLTVNSGSLGYGPWVMDINTPSNGIKRLNDEATKDQEQDPNSIVNGSLSVLTFGKSWGLDFDDQGNLYVSDEDNNVIRKINLEKRTVKTLVGHPGKQGSVDGKKSNAYLNRPRGIAWNKDYTILYISDFGGSKIRAWSFD